jgi:hypothetical protein
VVRGPDMCVPCVFYDKTQPCPCMVLRDAGILPDGVMDGLVRQYCMNGFLMCPIFLRVQRKLEAAHQRPAPTAAPTLRRESGVFRREGKRRRQAGCRGKRNATGGES